MSTLHYYLLINNVKFKDVNPFCDEVPTTELSMQPALVYFLLLMVLDELVVHLRATGLFFIAACG